VSQHHDHVFRIDRRDGDPWIARAFSPARPRAGVEGDAAILRFLERHDYPAERLATDDAVSVFDDSTVLVTRLVPGGPLPVASGHKGIEKFAIVGDLLGRLHTLPVDESVSRPVGRAGMIPAARAARVRTCWRPLHSSMPSIRRSLRPSANGSSSSATRCARLTMAKGCLRRWATAISFTPRIT
jgi:hypothetical protein